MYDGKTELVLQAGAKMSMSSMLFHIGRRLAPTVLFNLQVPVCNANLLGHLEARYLISTIAVNNGCCKERVRKWLRRR